MDDLLRKARSAIDESRLTDARVLLNLVVEEEPQNQEALKLLFEVEEETESAGEAESVAPPVRRSRLAEVAEQVDQLLGQNRLSDARWALEQAIEASSDPGFAELASRIRKAENREERLRKRVAEAIEHLEEGQVEEAEKILQRLEPGDAAHPEIVRLSQHLEDFQRALVATLTGRSQALSLRLEQAEAAIDEGQFGPARLHLERAREMAPASKTLATLVERLAQREAVVERRIERASLDLEQGRMRSAKEAIRELRLVAPRHPRTKPLSVRYEEKETVRSELERAVLDLIAEGRPSSAARRLDNEVGVDLDTTALLRQAVQQASQGAGEMRSSVRRHLAKGKLAKAVHALQSARHRDNESEELRFLEKELEDRFLEKSQASHHRRRSERSEVEPSSENVPDSTGLSLRLSRGLRASEALGKNESVPPAQGDGDHGISLGPSDEKSSRPSRGLWWKGLILLVTVGGIVTLWNRNRGPSIPEIERTLIAVQGAVAFGCREGDTLCAEDEKPASRVEGLGSFHIARDEVTHSLYRRCIGAGVCRAFEAAESPPALDHPVSHISWHEARSFCQWVGGRLPTEFEWETAARKRPEDRRQPGGKEELLPAGNHGAATCCGEDDSDGWLRTGPVGKVGTNSLGIAGMAGNVAEWTLSPYRPYLDADLAGKTDIEETPELVVIRGGSFLHPPEMLRPSARQAMAPAIRSGLIGFRCVWPRT